MSYRTISADCHLDITWLPPDTFTARAPADMKERVPHVRENADGVKYWWVDGEQMWGGRVGWYGPGTNGGKRAEVLVREGFTKGDLRCSNHEQRKADMVRDGIDSEVIYGILAVDRSIPDKKVLEATYKSYNTFVSEWQQHDPDWLVPIAEIPNHDGQVAADELRRVKEIGLRGVEFAPATMSKPLWDDEWIPLWEAVEDTQLSFAFHAFNISVTFSETEHPAAAGTHLVLAPSRADEVLCILILSGLLERYPKAKMILGESGIGWIPYMLERLDYSYDRRMGDLNLPLMPSEYFKRQVYATYIQDYFGTKAMWELGYLDNIMWSTDYPHRDSTWPDSQENMDLTFKGLPEEVKKACVYDNVVRIYGLKD